jgi:thiamine pyrophosphokinase
VAGGAGGRLDHLLANIMTIGSPRFASIPVDAYLGGAYVAILHGGGTPRSVRGEPGSLLTLVPLHGDAIGVTTEGLQYPLHDEDLPAGTSRGVSNVVVALPASVALRRGTLAIIQPGGEPQ